MCRFFESVKELNNFLEGSMTDLDVLDVRAGLRVACAAVCIFMLYFELWAVAGMFYVVMQIFTD